MDDLTKDLEALSTDPVVKALIPVAGMLLNIACPAVPAVVWVALITAVVSGDLTPDHIKAFMDAHGIKAYAEYDMGTTSLLALSQAGETLAPGTTNSNMVTGQSLELKP